MGRRNIVVGTRGSQLALAQTGLVAEALQAAHPGLSVETRIIRTSGDRSEAALTQIGGRGVFVAELEQALLAGEIDVAVHSLKDLPVEETPGLVIAAIPRREDPRDALVSQGGLLLVQLPPGAVVGTGSPRRACQIAALRPDLRIEGIRGNVDTRLRKVDEGHYDAVVLAAAGLSRLGCLGKATEVFSPDVFLPAVGQGALAVQVRTNDQEARHVVAALDDPATRAAVTAERALERRLGGGCHAAVAALAEARDGRVWLRALAGRPSGAMVRGQAEGPEAEAEVIGARLAEELLSKGAAALLEGGE